MQTSLQFDEFFDENFQNYNFALFKIFTKTSHPKLFPVFEK